MMIQSMPHSWRAVKLGDITSSIERRNPKSCFDGTFSYIDISSVDNSLKKVVGNIQQNVNEAPSRARQLVFSGDVLVSTVRPGLNAVAAVPAELANAVASTGFCVLRPKPEFLMSEYLLHFVRTPPFIQSLVGKQKGGSYPAITDGDVRSVAIHLPPVSEQNRIVEILREVEVISNLQGKADAKTSELIPAMFFDHFIIGQNHNFLPLHKLADVVSGVAIGRKRKGMSIEVPYLRVANVQAGFVDLSEVKTTTATDEEILQFALKSGDVLMTEGGDFDKLGRGCLWDGQVDPCIHQNHVFRVRPKPGKLNARFFAHYLQSARAKHYFLRCAKKTTNLASINLTQLKALPVPDVSIDDQEMFELQIQLAAECSSPDATKTILALTQSLYARAFSGQLTANWREAHQDKLALEARERDAALKEVGASVSRIRQITAQVDEEIREQRTDGIYSDLNREQRELLLHIQRKVGAVGHVKYFSARSLSQSLDGPLRRNPQAIDGHLAVLAVRGLVVPVSREEQTEDTGEFVFGNAYRLPLEDHSDVITDEAGNVLTIESGEVLVTEGVGGDRSRGRELERLAALLEKERC